MTPAEAVRRVEAIRAVVHDPEAAHAMEDQLWQDVLMAIGKGAIEARALAEIALRTKAIEFDRWYA